MAKYHVFSMGDSCDVLINMDRLITVELKEQKVTVYVDASADMLLYEHTFDNTAQAADCFLALMRAVECEADWGL